jgi:hypothetical protein
MTKDMEKYVGPRQLRTAKAAGRKSPDWVVGGTRNREEVSKRDVVDELQVIVDAVDARQIAEAAQEKSSTLHEEADSI